MIEDFRKAIAGYLVFALLIIVFLTNDSLHLLNTGDLSLNNNDKSDFSITFIDVGQGDCILVSCNNHYMLVDGGSKSASSIVYTYLKQRNINKIDYLINTHPDADHVGGLAGALNYATADNVYCSYESQTETFKSFKKYLNGTKITIPKSGDEFYVGFSLVKVLACNVGAGNDASIVLKVYYGTKSFLLTGDAERAVEDYLIENEINIKSDVLKVAHHGSKYSTYHRFLYDVNPDYAVISVGENSYGHPSEEVLSKLRDARVKTFRTDLQGDITFKCDGNNIYVETEKNSRINTLLEVGENSLYNTENYNYKYVLNNKSMRFHHPYCSSVNEISENNKSISDETRETLIELGYKPCGSCNP